MSTYGVNQRPNINVPQQQSDFDPVKFAMWAGIGFFGTGLLIAMYQSDQSTRSGRVQRRVAVAVAAGFLFICLYFMFWFIVFLINPTYGY